MKISERLWQASDNINTGKEEIVTSLRAVGFAEVSDEMTFAELAEYVKVCKIRVGKNYFWNSSDFRTLGHIQFYNNNPDRGFMEIVSDDTYGNVIHVESPETASAFFRNRIGIYGTLPIANGQYWTYSFKAKGYLPSATVGFRSTGIPSHVSTGNIKNQYIESENWKTYSFTYYIDQAENYITGENGTAPVINFNYADIYITEMKLEQSKYPTPYCPAPDDPFI